MYLVVCLCYYSFDLELVAGEHESSDKASTPTGEEQLPEYSKELDDVTKNETGEMDGMGGREVSGSEDMINIPSPIPAWTRRMMTTRFVKMDEKVACFSQTSF